MVEAFRSLAPAMGILLLVFGVLVIALPQLLIWIVGLTMIVAGIVLLLGAFGAPAAYNGHAPMRYRRV
jgi:uncharacterized membrane protein HdeD (DUF308 family)